jgi:hypothetical protein
MLRFCFDSWRPYVFDYARIKTCKISNNSKSYKNEINIW